MLCNANYRKCDRFARTPLHWSVAEGKVDCVRALTNPITSTELAQITGLQFEPRKCLKNETINSTDYEGKKTIDVLIEWFLYNKSYFKCFYSKIDLSILLFRIALLVIFDLQLLLRYLFTRAYVPRSQGPRYIFSTPFWVLGITNKLCVVPSYDESLCGL